MANVIKTVMTYPLNGQVDFAITFEYLARKFVQVTLIGKDRKVLILNSDYRFSTRMQITTNKVWGSSDGYQYIEIRRFTSATERLVDFADGSILRAYDLNIAQIQTIHIAEEARDLTADTIAVNNDGDLDARGRRIVNVTNPIHDLDVVNLQSVKQWNNSALNSANRSKDEADRSWREAERAKSEADRSWREAERSLNEGNRSEAQAGISTTNAQNTSRYKDQAQQAATNANKSAQQAAQSTETIADLTNTTIQNANNATKSADRAKSEADRAKSEADKLGNMNALGGAIDSIANNEVLWKYRQVIPYVDVANKVNIGYRKSESATYEPFLEFHYNKDTYCGKFSAKANKSLHFDGAHIYFNCDTTVGNMWGNNINARAGFTMQTGQFWNHGGEYIVADKPVRLDETFNQVPAITMRNGENNTNQCIYSYMTVNKSTQEVSYDLSVNNTNTSALFRFKQTGLETNKNITVAWGGRVSTLQENGDISTHGGIWEGGNLSSHINSIKNRSLIDIQLGGKQSKSINNSNLTVDLDGGQVVTGISWARNGSYYIPTFVYFRELIAFRGDGSWYVIKSQ